MCRCRRHTHRLGTYGRNQQETKVRSQCGNRKWRGWRARKRRNGGGVLACGLSLSGGSARGLHRPESSGPARGVDGDARGLADQDGGLPGYCVEGRRSAGAAIGSQEAGAVR